MMKSIRTSWMTALALLCLFAGTVANAQDNNAPRPNQGRGGRRDRNAHLSTVSLAYLKVTLSLDKDQESKIKDIQDQLRKDTAPDPAATPPTPLDPEKLKELTKKADEAIQALLKDDQKALVVQSLKDADILRSVGLQLPMVSVLKLTEEQKKQIATIAENVQKETRELPREERRTKGAELRKKAHEEALKLLTEDQNKAMEQYEKEHPRRRRPQGN